MEWTQVSIFTTSNGLEPLTDRLLNIGINGFIIEDKNDFQEFVNEKTIHWDYIDDELINFFEDLETCIKLYLPMNNQGNDQLLLIKQQLSKLKEIDINNEYGRLEYELLDVKEEDWEHNWKQYFKPFNVGNRFKIKPSWESLDTLDNRIVLEIDPASSFGTGQHYTTKLCLEEIEKLVLVGDKVLDMGCGSGILSIAALLVGAKTATAVDIDENSVNVTKENAIKNNIASDRLNAFCGNVINNNELIKSIGSGYDIICANIVSDIIIAMSSLFSNLLRNGGTLITSGIIEERTEEIITSLNNNNFIIEEIRYDGGWAVVVAKKP